MNKYRYKLLRLTVFHVLILTGGLLLVTSPTRGQQACPPANQYWQAIGETTIQDSVLDLAVHPNVASTIYVGTRGHLLKSDDCGRTLDTLKTAERGFSRIFINRDDPQHIITADTTIIESTDGGQTWQPIDQGIEYGSNGLLRSLDVARNDFNLIYAGLGGDNAGGIYKTTDGGSSWSSVVDQSDTLLTEQTDVSDISINNDHNTDTVFVGIDEEGTVLRTHDAGQTWDKTPLVDRNGDIGILNSTFYTYASIRNEGLFEIHYQTSSDSLELNKRTIPDSVRTISGFKDFSCEQYMNTGLGIYHVVTCVFASEESQRAEHWTTLNDSLPSQQTTDIELGADEDNLFTATKLNDNSFKLYIRLRPQIADLTNNDTPRQFKLHANYPNPFNPTTQITFSLPQATEVQLTVYDVLGRRVATLVNGKRGTGRHSVTFDARNLSSGVYIYQLETNRFYQSRKMLLIK